MGKELSGGNEHDALSNGADVSWLEAAARLPGKSLHVGIALWLAAGLAGTSSVPLSNVAGLRFGLDRNAKYRALLWLEGAGLVKVRRKIGRAPVVTLLLSDPSDAQGE